MSDPGAPFRLVKHDERPDPNEARRLLSQRDSISRLTSHEEAAADYVLDRGLETAVNMAIAVADPLLVTGGPGTGKTQLAYFIGHYFGIAVRPFHVKSTSSARDLKWEFDAVGYLQSAYAAAQGVGARRRDDFLEPGPLWKAYVDPEPSVLLIDEIDKAPRDFPNDLLHELDQGWFFHPFEQEQGNPIRVPKTPGRQPPIVVITSNVERQLPAPFLRRCVFHHIELTEALVGRAVGARAKNGAFPRLAPEVRQLAIDRFWELRDPGRGLQKPPATGELLVWLAILNAQGTAIEALRAPLHELPCVGALVKDYEDLARLKT